MKKTTTIFLVFVAFLCNSKQLSAQDKFWSMGMSLGVANYLGDVTPKANLTSFDTDFTRFAVALDVTRRLSSRFSVRGTAQYMRLGGDDFESADPEDPESVGRYVRNLHFRNDVLELSFKGVFDIIPTTSSSVFNPYIFAGVAGFYHNPKAKAPEGFVGERWVALQPIQTENVDYSRFGVAVPAGIGLEFRLNDKVNLGVEFCYRMLFTDYIDDVSSAAYVDPTGKSDYFKAISNRSGEIFGGFERKDRVLPKGFEIVEIDYSDGTSQFIAEGVSHLSGERRGNPEDNDAYFVTAIRMQYNFRNKSEARFR